MLFTKNEIVVLRYIFNEYKTFELDGSIQSYLRATNIGFGCSPLPGLFPCRAPKQLIK